MLGKIFLCREYMGALIGYSGALKRDVMQGKTIFIPMRSPSDLYHSKHKYDTNHIAAAKFLTYAWGIPDPWSTGSIKIGKEIGDVVEACAEIRGDTGYVNGSDCKIPTWNWDTPLKRRSNRGIALDQSV